MKVYLGDSVYAAEGEWAGVVVLTTENGYRSNTIVLEPDTLRALDVFRDTLRRKREPTEDSKEIAQ